jgi:hypothetical protein
MAVGVMLMLLGWGVLHRLVKNRVHVHVHQHTAAAWCVRIATSRRTLAARSSAHHGTACPGAPSASA